MKGREPDAPSKGLLSWLGSGRQSGQVGFFILKCLAPHLVLGRCREMEVQRLHGNQM